tara:strand:- start:86 stop:427 length:342 start_codon:yes stop_codon:yes gene_type:complete
MENKDYIQREIDRLAKSLDDNEAKKKIDTDFEYLIGINIISNENKLLQYLLSKNVSLNDIEKLAIFFYHYGNRFSSNPNPFFHKAKQLTNYLIENQSTASYELSLLISNIEKN